MRTVAFDRMIETDLVLPGGMPLEDSGREAPDQRIETLPSAALSPGEPIYRLEGGVLSFSPPRVGIYRCRADRIEILPRSGAVLQDIVGLLLATALPASLWLSGDFILHAAAVRLPGCDRAIALAGPSGCGKSTVAAALIARGSELVADDTVRVVLNAGEPIASGLPGGWFSRTDGEARPFHPVPRDRILRRCPLGSIVILSRSGRSSPPSRLAPVDAVEQLLANRHRPAIPALLGKHLDVLRFCSFLAHNVPVYLWPRQHGDAAIDDRSLNSLLRCVEKENRR